MSYIGHSGLTSNIQKLDSLTFAPGASYYTTVNGIQITVGSPTAVIISLGGVVLEPVVDYTIIGSRIYFSVDPVPGTSFFGIALGQSMNIGVPGDNTITNAKLAQPVAVSKGGTGATTADGALTGLGGGTAGVALFKTVTHASIRSQLALGTAATKNSGTLAGEVLLISENNKLPVLDGSNLTNLPSSGGGSGTSGFKNLAVITSTQAWVIPAGITTIKVKVVGGGGGGGAGYTACGTTAIGGGGGGSGAVGISYLTNLTPGNNINIFIGAGGAAQVAGSSTSITSGTQTINTITAAGGNPGTVGKSPGDGGVCTGAQNNIKGVPGTAGQFYSLATNNIGGGGGSAPGYGGGGLPVLNGNGAAGTNYGAGGGGGSSSATPNAGSGFQGVVEIEY